MDNQTTEQPQINFTVPAGVEPAPTQAEISGEVSQNAEISAAGFPGKPLSQPEQANAPQVEVPQVYVYPTGVSVIDSGDGDIIRFEVIFNVSTYNGANSTTSTVKKVFEVSKQKLAGDMASELASAKVNVVESKTEDKKLNNRMRELAGIPGKGTFV